jgi:hypothetical protein
MPLRLVKNKREQRKAEQEKIWERVINGNGRGNPDATSQPVRCSRAMMIAVSPPRGHGDVGHRGHQLQEKDRAREQRNGGEQAGGRIVHFPTEPIREPHGQTAEKMAPRHRRPASPNSSFITAIVKGRRGG